MIERALAVAYRGEPGINPRRETKGATPASYPATAGLAALRRRHGTVGVDETTWVPPVLRMVATEDQGVTELAQAVDAFIAWSEDTGRRAARRRERAYAQVVRALSALLLAPYAREPGSEELPAILGPFDRTRRRGSREPARGCAGVAARASAMNLPNAPAPGQSVLNAITSFTAIHLARRGSPPAPHELPDLAA